MEAKNLVEPRCEPPNILQFISNQQSYLPHDRLGLIQGSRAFLSQTSEEVRIVHLNHEGNSPLRRLIIQEIQQTSLDMLANSLV